VSYRLGEILLVPLVFSDGSASKRRPVMVVWDGGDDDVLVAPVTSHPARPPFDVGLTDWQQAGLRLPSTARVQKLATVEKSTVIRPLGRLTAGDLVRVKAAMSRLFGEVLAC
jgi:mRNA interferase MazF